MDDLRLFRISDGTTRELPATTAPLERHLQKLIDDNMASLLGVRHVDSYYRLTGRDKGEIDALGLDANAHPVVIEYKRGHDPQAITQGLWYLSWLREHPAEFQILVARRLGSTAASSIDWHGARLVCVARDFTHKEISAVSVMQAPVQLVRYRYFGDDLLALDVVPAQPGIGPTARDDRSSSAQPTRRDQSVSAAVAAAPPALKDIYAEAESLILGLGPDVQKKVTKTYVTFTRVSHFASIRLNRSMLIIGVKADLRTISLEEGFSRDVSSLGHLGTGNLEIRAHNQVDLMKALPLIKASYESAG